MSETTEAVCETCPRHCLLNEGAVGFCRARRAEDGCVVADNYGRITSIALDPSNLRCPFCQNDAISQHGERESDYRMATPIELADLALRLRDGRGNIGLAYTYNEPLVGWEFVRDTAREIRDRGLVNVLVSNGCAEAEVIEELAPLIDAANIDLKGPSQDYYNWIGGDFGAVCRTIRTLHGAGCHVEVTTLVVPGHNDADADIDAVTAFLASVSPDIPLHVTRFFPRWRMADAQPTPVAAVRHLADVARARLRRVLVGNC